MRKSILSASVAMALGSNIAGAAITITWSGAAVPEATYPSVVYTAGFATGAEFRMITASGSGIGGFPPGFGPSGNEKDVMFGGVEVDMGMGPEPFETWTFSNGGNMTGVGNTPTNPGAIAVGAPAGPSACPTAATCPTIEQNAVFFGNPFTFLAPEVGSAAAAAYGTATISSSVTSGGPFTMTFPVLEAQWSSAPFKLGRSTGGITFNCTTAGSTVACHAEHLIDATEEQGNAFQGWTAQWDFHGTIALPVTTTTTTTSTTTSTTTTTTSGTTTTTTTLTPPPPTTTTTGDTTTTTTGDTTTTTTGSTTTTTAATTTTTTLPEDVAPELSATQAGELRTQLKIGDGDVTLASSSPATDCDWSNTDNPVQPTPLVGNPVTISGEHLTGEGTFTLRSLCSPEAEKVVRVVTEFGAGGSQDANNNGLGDDLEPAGMPANEIPVDGADTNDEPVRAEAGVKLSLGKTAVAAGSPGAGVSAQDIEDNNTSGGGIGVDGDVSSSCVETCISIQASGIAAGDSVKIAFKSGTIPARAVYRKFHPNLGWLAFDTSQGDTATSAPGNPDGSCPAPGSGAYTHAAPDLVAGHDCVQIMVKDGGPNDTDGVANGVVVDPSGVANGDTTPPVITLLGANPQVAFFDKSGVYNDPGFTATDDVDGNITANVVVTGNVDTSNTDDQLVSYDVMDAAGNAAATVTRQVRVTRNAGEGDNNNHLGCSASPTPVNPATRADWWLLGGMLAWLGSLVQRRKRARHET